MRESKTLAVVGGAAGRRLYVEVSPSAIASAEARGGFQPAGTLEEIAEHFASLEDAIEATCATIFAGVARLTEAASPSRLSAEMSFELGIDGTIWFVAKGTSKAAVKVTAEWDLRPRD